MPEKNIKVKIIFTTETKKNSTKENRQLLTNVQNGVRTKPPTVIVKGKGRKKK